MRFASDAFCEIARVIAKSFLVLVGAVVFFIDHDEPECVQGREERAARSDGDHGLSRTQSLPLCESFARLESAVQHGDLIAKARANPGDDLMCERNLWNQYECLSPGLECFGYCTQIDFGLAAARDAME